MSERGDRPATVPAGWYENYDGSGTMRYWDGSRWTHHLRTWRSHPLPNAAQSAAANPVVEEQLEMPQRPCPPGGIAGDISGEAPTYGTPVQDFDAPLAGMPSKPGPDYPRYPIYPPYGASGEVAMTNALSVLSLVSAIIWACGAGSLVGIISGHVARHQVKKSAGGQSGGGVALAGLLLGYLGLLATIVAVIFLVLVGGSSKTSQGRMDDLFADLSVQIDLADAAAAEEAWRQANGTYTSAIEDLEAEGFFASDGSVYQGGAFAMEILASESGYCLQATSASGITFHHDSADGAGQGACPAGLGSGTGGAES